MISGTTIALAISLECEPKRQRHGPRPRPSTMPLLAFIRKDTGWRIDWQIRRLLGPCIRPLGRRFSQPDPETLLLWRYRGRSGDARNAKGRFGPSFQRILSARGGIRFARKRLAHAIVVGATGYIAS